MKIKKNIIVSFFIFFNLLFNLPYAETKNKKSLTTEKEVYVSTKPYWEVKLSTQTIEIIKEKIKEQPVIRGIHLTSWVAGSDKLRREIIENIRRTVINTVVVAVREKNGEVYIPSPLAIKYGSYTPAISNPQKIIEEFKKENLYVIARVVCFHDNIMPKKKPDWAVKDIDGEVWKTRKGDMWLDPYNREVWEYILDVAIKAAEAGFSEIQFDYVRYPTEGDTKRCRYSQIHSRENANKNLIEFFSYVRKKLTKYNVKITADVFGLTTASDMGIGQDLSLIAENVDRVYPMMYPSHYYSGEYNLKDPESQPYKVIDRGLKQAMNKTGLNYYKIVPYLQDFSLKVKYTPFDVRAQIIAAKNNYIPSFLLWNPASKYSWEALTPQAFCAFIEPEKCYKE